MPTVPILDVQLNSLDMLLFGVGWRLGHLAEHDQDFLTLINNKDVVLQFLSQDGVARFYTIHQNKIRQNLGTADHAHLTITFKDSLTGAKLLAKGDTAALMSAIQAGQMTVTGDYKLVLWFASLTKHIAKVPDKYAPYLNQAKPYLKKAGNLAHHIHQHLSTTSTKNTK